MVTTLREGTQIKSMRRVEALMEDILRSIDSTTNTAVWLEVLKFIDGLWKLGEPVPCTEAPYRINILKLPICFDTVAAREVHIERAFRGDKDGEIECRETTATVGYWNNQGLQKGKFKGKMALVCGRDNFRFEYSQALRSLRREQEQLREGNDNVQEDVFKVEIDEEKCRYNYDRDWYCLTVLYTARKVSVVK